MSRRSVWLRAVRMGLTVGLLQAAINQGDVWARGAVTSSVVLKTIVSPLIGFTLVLFASAETVVDRLRKEERTVMRQLVHEFAERFRETHDLTIHFTEPAAERLVALALEQSVPIRDPWSIPLVAASLRCSAMSRAFLATFSATQAAHALTAFAKL